VSYKAAQFAVFSCQAANGAEIDISEVAKLRACADPVHVQRKCVNAAVEQGQPLTIQTIAFQVDTNGIGIARRNA
jgi:hypothetical protein